jgi:4-hydroxy-3-methylbut-2-enyl diphosphate reductase
MSSNSVGVNFPFVSRSLALLKAQQKVLDGKKKNFTPFSIMKSANLEFVLARHFGFCFGVERAVQIAYEALDLHRGEEVFLLSEMIHNPDVNEDLKRRGVVFLFDTLGNELRPLTTLNPESVVILPAFGVSLDIEARLKEQGVLIERYDTTCPFVERVWKRARQLGASGYTIVVHGKPLHEETRATFSRASATSSSIVVLSLDEARLLASYIKGEVSIDSFWRVFDGRVSSGFDPEVHLQRVGVINQTTMLAEETSELANILREALLVKYGPQGDIKDVFADTRDTLCYATSENQSSVHALLNEEVNLALVIGGFNSSNTTHLAKICGRKFPTFHIRSAQDILSLDSVTCLDLSTREVMNKNLRSCLPVDSKPIRIAVTAGASTPDAIVEEVMDSIAELVRDH